MFEPGTRWQYGQGVDWAGRLVEAISGATLEDYFQNRILRPLGMNDTSSLLSKTGANLATRVANGDFACPELEFGVRGLPL
jgi:CubicO group peptidase (beta-lactamase class C family)